ncbi:hypothetical protein [Selenomonas ruminantium]|uniref:Uncharacterized protein n=1 Tax=Selenomonas ruminantium TaxID=971 RepID=A0A1I0YDC3_SELRU|nr:hypothetical protein [Selenomonas ruminantium]SFB10786.1 hypothetical protein SAMN05216587_11198 [Selenomonas ruminantium]
MTGTAFIRWLTVDKIVGAGLVLALILSLFTGGSKELQTSIASGLIGWMSRGALEHGRDDAYAKSSDH